MKRIALISTVTVALAIAAGIAPGAGAATGTRTPHQLKHRAHHVARKSKRGVGRSRHVSFYATVVRANAKGLVVRTSDGRQLRFSAAQIARTPSRRRPAHTRRHHGRRSHSLRRAGDTGGTGPIAINILGLQPGVTVLISETVAPDGTITITITLPSNLTEQQRTSGVVTDVAEETFEITTADGSPLRLHMAADRLAALNLQPCSTVNVTYHQDGGMLIADAAQVTGASTSGDCAPTYDASGPITDVSESSLTINSDHGPITFAVGSPDLTDGFQKGDVVDVTYTTNSDGSLNAVDVQYVEQDASGTVTSVSSKSLTITDGTSGQPETFIADPSNGLQLCTYAFDGVHTGDQVDVSYHQTAAGLVADSVDDMPASS